MPTDDNLRKIPEKCIVCIVGLNWAEVNQLFIG